VRFRRLARNTKRILPGSAKPAEQAQSSTHARAGADAVDQHVQQALQEQQWLRHGRHPRVRSVQPREGHGRLPYLHGRADGASDGRAPEPVRQAVQRRQGLQREGRRLREHVPCRRHPLRRPLCQAGL